MVWTTFLGINIFVFFCTQLRSMIRPGKVHSTPNVTLNSLALIPFVIFWINGETTRKDGTKPNFRWNIQIQKPICEFPQCTYCAHYEFNLCNTFWVLFLYEHTNTQSVAQASFKRKWIVLENRYFDKRNLIMWLLWLTNQVWCNKSMFT